MNELKIGTRIAELRHVNNITQLELAEKLGVTDRAVSKWETGGSYPDIFLLPKIADIFNVSVDYLLRGKPVVKQKFYLDLKLLFGILVFNPTERKFMFEILQGEY